MSPPDCKVDDLQRGTEARNAIVFRGRSTRHGSSHNHINYRKSKATKMARNQGVWIKIRDRESFPKGLVRGRVGRPERGTKNIRR
jgi:hypothetical protein